MCALIPGLEYGSVLSLLTERRAHSLEEAVRCRWWTSGVIGVVSEVLLS